MKIVARTEDRVWLSVVCGDGIEGWVLASEVDLSTDRKVYMQHDSIQNFVVNSPKKGKSEVKPNIEGSI